jgi:hypothetical protein
MYLFIMRIIYSSNKIQFCNVDAGGIHTYKYSNLNALKVCNIAVTFFREDRIQKFINLALSDPRHHE